MNPNGLGFNNSLTYIGKHKGMIRQFTCQNLHFGTTSSATVTWDSTTTLTFGKSGYTNVHFYSTPYIEAPNDDPREASYLAREKWCNNKFALKTSLSSYLTKTDASKYTTKSEVKSIVKSMVKSKYLN